MAKKASKAKKASNVETPLFQKQGGGCTLGLFQQKQLDADAMSTLIASEMNQLSVKEREAAFDDLHAITPVRKESAETVAELVKEFKLEIGKIREKSAYSKAHFLSPRAVNDPGFIRMFLRAEDYNPRMAAHRMVSYFQHKLELFGIEKLAKDITLDDLDDDDRAALHSGSIQCLSQKDRAGRTVIFSAQKLKKFKTLQNQLRAAWYLFMSLAHEEDVQRTGVVLVVYTIGVRLLDRTHLDYWMRSKTLSTSLPIKASSFHFCYDDAILRPLVTTVQTIIGRNHRARSRVHFGSQWECSYQLTSYGISKESLPVDDNGNIGNDWLLSYLKSRKQEEDEAKAKAKEIFSIQYPLSTDVLLGRGRPFQEFAGNIRLAEIIDEHREIYQQTKRKFGKTDISNRILKIIKSSNGRFLKKDDADEGAWVEVSDEMARQKISHCFRSKAKKRWPAPASVPSDVMSVDSDADISTGQQSKKLKHSNPDHSMEVVKSANI